MKKNFLMICERCHARMGKNNIASKELKSDQFRTIKKSLIEEQGVPEKRALLTRCHGICPRWGHSIYDTETDEEYSLNPESSFEDWSSFIKEKLFSN